MIKRNTTSIGNFCGLNRRYRLFCDQVMIGDLGE